MSTGDPPADRSDPQPSTSTRGAYIELEETPPIRSRRMPPPPGGDDELMSIPGLSQERLEQLRRRANEDVFSPTETLTSAGERRTSFLSPTILTPAEPRMAYRNNSTVSLPVITTMPMPGPASNGYSGDAPCGSGSGGTTDKDEHLNIRTSLPHLIVMDPPGHPKSPSKALPDHWRQFVRLDGSLYFYNPFERLVTTEDMHDPRLRNIIEKTAHKLAKIVGSSGIELPEDWELCIEIEMERNQEVLHYNYISHEEGQYFQLGDKKPVCAERSHYWQHVEKYCMHHEEIPPFAECDFLSELAYGATERILDNKGTTFRFTGLQTQALIGTYRELKEAQREGIAITPALIRLFARTMKLVEETRTNSKYGTRDAAAARKPSFSPATLKFRIIDTVLGFMFSGTHNMYRRRLMKTKFNNVLYLPDFRELLSDLIIEWGDSNLLSTVFVAANVSFLAINDLTVMQRTCALVSSLFAMISIAGGMHHIWNHRIKLDVEVLEATQYMNHGIIFGERGSVTILACFLALPIASLLWSFYAFTAALTAFCIQSTDVQSPVLKFMLFVSCLSGLTTVSFFWNIWVGWGADDENKEVEREPGRMAKIGSYFGLRKRGRRRGGMAVNPPRTSA